MKKIVLLFSLALIASYSFSQSKTYYTCMMNFQMYNNGAPSGRESITSRQDTITITPQAISITNYKYGSGKTSTFKVTSVKNNVYTCQVDDLESYKVYADKSYVTVENYIGEDLFVRRKYLMSPSSVK